mgnify:CR=1 FL=1
MLKEYEEKWPGKFIIKLSTKNQGITKNSNLAHFACRGKYIAWLGGDDLMLPDKISTQVEYMENHPNCTIVYHNLEVFNSYSNKVLMYFNEKRKYSGDASTSIKYGTFNGASSSMVRREKTPIHGFDERLPIASDRLYWVETLINGGTIEYIDKVLGKYRRHTENITNINNANIYIGHIDHINTCNIIMLKYPQYKKEALIALSYTYRSLRLLYQKKYFIFFLLLSLKINFNFKAFFALALSITTFGKNKK